MITNNDQTASSLRFILPSQPLTNPLAELDVHEPPLMDSRMYSRPLAFRIRTPPPIPTATTTTPADGHDDDVAVVANRALGELMTPPRLKRALEQRESSEQVALPLNDNALVVEPGSRSVISLFRTIIAPTRSRAADGDGKVADEDVEAGAGDYGPSCEIPLARIKTLMKRHGDVLMISGDSTRVLAKACAMFIVDLSVRSWRQTTQSRRRTMQKDDVALAAINSPRFDFLEDIMRDSNSPPYVHQFRLEQLQRRRDIELEERRQTIQQEQYRRRQIQLAMEALAQSS